MKYKPNRGGHAPGHLRDQLIELIEEDIKPENYSVDTLYGKLWNCTDCAPGSMCDHVGLPQGSSFAQVVRKLKHG